MTTFQLNILAAESPFYIGECESLIIPTPQGKYGIMAHHINTIIAVIPGAISFRPPGKDMQIAAVSHGLVKIESNSVLILVDSAEHPQDIDANRAERSALAAKEAMQHKSNIREDHLAQARLARAIARMKVKEDYDRF